MTHRRLSVIAAVLLSGSAALPASAADPVKLKGYNAAIADSSVSGISSGAFMAVQFGTAWSSVIKGVGIVAGGPYFCDLADAGDFMNGYIRPITRALGPCMQGKASDLDTSDFVGKADANAASGKIDPLDHLKRQRIYLFHGYNDSVVAKSSTDATAAFYRHYLGDAGRGNLFYQAATGAGHSLVVQREGQTGLNACNANASPFIDQCGYDQAGIILQHIYGRLKPPGHAPLGGTVLRFDQAPYTGRDIPDALSLGDNGYLFVPQDCANGAACRVHIALHGCAQDAGHIDRRYVDSTGYNEWADTNHIIVLYPQTKASSIAPANPQACWDWWSYINHTDDYVTKSGLQIKVIKAMLDALTVGAQPPATTGDVSPTVPMLAVIDTSDSSADLAFDPLPGTASYRISRAGTDDVFAVVGETSGPSFVDTGLAPQTAYRWRATIVKDGVEGAVTADVQAATRATPAACDTPGSCPIAP